MRQIPTIILCLVGLVAIVAIAVTNPPASLDERHEARAPTGPGRVCEQFQVNCPAAGGTPVELLVPMDGGVAGKPHQADSVYAAPVVDGGVDIRVGFGTGLTSTTGFEVGPTGRDGEGWPAAVVPSSNVRCISTTSSAQRADVAACRE